MIKGFKDDLAEQRERLKLSEHIVDERIDKSPFGEKTKALARKWSQHESFGGVGWGVCEITPVMQRAEGAYLYDLDGKEYLDLLAGFSVSTLGGCDQEITKIIQDQAGKLTHFFDPPRVEGLRFIVSSSKG